MMGSRIALCLDEATCRNPELVGLDGESLEAQSWLDLYFSGDDARLGIGADDGLAEAWVVSSEDVEPINLAATLKSDRPDLCVRLVEFDGCGSLFSRAHTANIDEVADRNSFVRRYTEMKGAFAHAGNDEPAEEPVPADEPSPTDGPGSAEGALAVAEGEPVLIVPFESPVLETTPLVQPAPAIVPTRTGSNAFVMPVVSGSGGAGKSSVSVIGALIARNMGYRTLLLDYDLQFGDVDVMAGIENALPVDEAMMRPDKLERELQREGGLSLLAAPSRLESAEEVVRGMPQFLEVISSCFDVIIANTGAAWAEQHAVLLERSSAALFLVDQRASSVRACKHALELCARCGIASGPFQFALNRCQKNAPLTSADVTCALGGVPVYELRDGGRDVEDYLGGGAADELMDSGNEFCTSLEHVMGRLLPNAPERLEAHVISSDERRPSRRRGRHAGRKRGWGAS